MKTIATVIASCLIGTCGGYYSAEYSATHLASIDSQAASIVTASGEESITPIKRTLSGDYLSSLFAQRHHDWTKAGEYLQTLMTQTPDDPSISRRAMVLAMGAGDMQTAMTLAQKVSKDKEGSSLAYLFLAVQAFHDKDYKSAAADIKQMPDGSLSDFIMPLLNSWAKAGVGTFDVSKLDKNTLHLHHAVLIADFLGKKYNVEPVLDKMAAQPDLTIEDMERVANLYAHIDKPEKAMPLYQKILDQWPDHPTATKKLAVLKEGKKLETLVAVKSPADGIAAALYDMANLLFREYADDSAQVFSQMALYLMPDMTEARLLVAAIDARNGRFDEAIRSYRMIGPENDYYIEARHRAADLMEDNNNADGAIAELHTLASDHNDIDSLVKIGDIYRRKEDFKKAIGVYNDAATKLGGTVPKEYWNLLYVRGMSYERDGQWDKAEADLKAALNYQPDHPFLLNYLGYAWADKGQHLDEALSLVQKAATVQPNDGYIVDSLGWVFYRLGRYGEGLPNLEKAVELLPYDPVVNDHLGDDYWQVGRKREAQFQWKRAENFSKDKDMIAKISEKIEHGLPAPTVPSVKEAHSQPSTPSGEPTATP